MLIACAGTRELTRARRYFLEGLGALYAEAGAVLISGGAVGSDQAFMLGAITMGGKVIACLPWRGYEAGFNTEDPGLFDGEVRVVTAAEAEPRHWQLAQQCHPAWHSLSAGVKKLMVRNAMIVSPAGQRPDVLLALPNRGKLGWGGTGHTIRCALQLQVPVFLVDSWSSYP